MKVMETDFMEKLRLFFELSYRAHYGNDTIAVINGGEPGDYTNNPTVEEYYKKGYKMIDANMCGFGEERGEILIFSPVKGETE